VNKSLQDVGIAAQAERMAVLEQQNRDLQAKFVAHSAQAQVYHGFIDHAMRIITRNVGTNRCYDASIPDGPCRKPIGIECRWWWW
jgi:hypothetical protein